MFKKISIIIAVIVVFLIVLGWYAYNYNQDVNENNNAARQSNDYGPAECYYSVDVPDWMPTDLIYPEAIINSIESTDSARGGNNYSVTYCASISKKELINWYDATMAKAGYTKSEFNEVITIDEGIIEDVNNWYQGDLDFWVDTLDIYPDSDYYEVSLMIYGFDKL